MSNLNERVALIIISICSLPSATLAQAPLTLTEAETIAIRHDPAREAMTARALAQDERAVAVGEWPDPQLRFGFVNLPVDSFALSQEPMTQTVIGLRQPIPTRSLRESRSAGNRAMAAVHGAERALRERRIRRMVRELWLELAYWNETEVTIAETRVLFGSLVEVTRSVYAVGRANQQDIIRAELELERLTDRALLAAQRSQELRASLSEWLGSAAYGELELSTAGSRALPAREFLADALGSHPLISVRNAQLSVADAALDVADASYSPNWMVDINYGFRAGSNTDGSDRSDFTSVMVSLDLPLFADDRQDRAYGAAEAERAAAHSDRVDALRILNAELDTALAAWQHGGERLALYDDSLVRQSELQAQAALNAYRSDVGDFADLMRATINVLDVRLERLRLATDRQRARVAIAYLGGDPDA